MAKAKTRIYVVVGKDSGTHLVRAYSPTQARSYVSEKMFKVGVATQDTLVTLLSQGVLVEVATAPETGDLLTPPTTGEVAEPPHDSVLSNIDRSAHVTEVA